MIKNLFANILVVITSLLVTTPVWAHVVVGPKQVGVGAYQTFTMGVPVEKDIPTVGLRLVIPVGLEQVTPNVKPGWTIQVKKSGEGEGGAVTELSWTGGSIPVGQQDEFAFSAQAPASQTTLSWKAYQTYQDGSVVSWDGAPKASMSDTEREEMEKAGKGPYSETTVVNDLSKVGTNPAPTSSLPLKLSIVALVLSIAGMGMPWLVKSR